MVQALDPLRITVVIIAFRVFCHKLETTPEVTHLEHYVLFLIH